MRKKLNTFLNEDAPVNNVGSGNIRGAAPGEDPPIRKKDKERVFAGAKVFDVDMETILKCSKGKVPQHRYNRYVGEDELGEKIREYGRKNPKKSIVLRDATTGTMVFLRRKQLGEKYEVSEAKITTSDLEYLYQQVVELDKAMEGLLGDHPDSEIPVSDLGQIKASLHQAALQSLKKQIDSYLKEFNKVI